jgi:glutathione synthase
VKCPNIDTFLCTFKLFQYYLGKKEILQKFIPEETISSDVMRFFTKIIFTGDLTDQEEITNISLDVKSDTKKYVVKPQREGGGNNYYNDEILKMIDTEEIHSSIIMERINPPQQNCHLLQNHKISQNNCVSELGIYGIILSEDSTVHLNKRAGFLLRTKEHSKEEGGVATGNSVIDLPYLTDN